MIPSHHLHYSKKVQATILIFPWPDYCNSLLTASTLAYTYVPYSIISIWTGACYYFGLKTLHSLPASLREKALGHQYKHHLLQKLQAASLVESLLYACTTSIKHWQCYICLTCVLTALVSILRALSLKAHNIQWVLNKCPWSGWMQGQLHWWCHVATESPALRRSCTWFNALLSSP